ncbi:MAG TPA: S9 family peptidase [Thermomicrobiales bacterium]|nr:S9 family peptidase [Thermomicrobiales bacterium]
MVQQVAEFKTRAATYFDRPSFSQPFVMPDGDLVILDDRSGVPQLSRLDLDSGEVLPITSFQERVLTLGGSREGTIVFGMDSGGDEKQQIWRLSPTDTTPVNVTNQPTAMHEPGPVTPDGRTVMVKSNARDESTFDIVAIDLDSGSINTLMKDAGTALPVALSSDGNLLLVVRTNVNLDADVWLIDRRNASARNLTSHEGEAWVLGAAFTPDDEEVWFLTNEGTEFVRLDALDLGTSERRTILTVEGHDVESFRISPDGTRYVVAINDGGWSRVEIHNTGVRTPPIVLSDLDRGTVDRFAWLPDGSSVVFGFSTAEDPSAIVVVDNQGNFKFISGENPGRRPPVSTPELITFPTFDGLQIPGFFFRPAGDGPFPVLVEIHGGPESQRRLQYSSAVPTDQFIQSLGIAVLSLNIRGSIGYGKTYSHLDDKAKRLDAVKDVEAAVTWLRQRDDVIADRIAVMGQSYGGYMTLASLTFLPDLWSAAVDVVGIASFVTFLERTGPWRREHRSHEYGFLETDREMLEEISPLNYVDRISTPLFVIHGRNDPRVPLFEAEQIVAALAARQQEVELRVFDDEGHGLSKRQNRIDGYAAAGEFLVRHLLG